LIRYWLFLLCSFIWQRLPLKAGYFLAAVMGDITYLAWPQGRGRIKENMRRVLGPKADDRQVARLARQSVRNYMKYLVDFIRFPKLREEDIAQSIVFEGWSNFDKALEGGKGAIFIGMHIGNWDLAAAAICLRKYPLNVIAETFSPPKLNDLVQGPRMRWGMKVIPMERAARQVPGHNRPLRPLSTNRRPGEGCPGPHPANSRIPGEHHPAVPRSVVYVPANVGGRKQCRPLSGIMRTRGQAARALLNV